METIRAFIAINIGEEIRNGLEQLQRRLRKTHADVRWVKPENIHLTLTFLGGIDAGLIQPLETSLHENVQGLETLELQAKGTGFFGKPSRPKVIWAGITENPHLRVVHQRTLQAVQSLEIEQDNKPFSPHLTLGRIKDPEHIDALLQQIERVKDLDLGSTTIGHIELIQSTLTPHGADYKVLTSIPLV